MLKKVILIFLGCMCLSALYADTHKQRMIDLINSKEYEQAARELPLVEDWIFDPEDERMYMNVSAGVDLLQYVDTLDIYTSEKDSLFKFLGCVCRGYGKYFMKQEEYKTAIPFMELSESIFAIVPGKTHPYYASIIDELLIVYKNTGDHSKEASVFLKSLNVRKNDLLETPPDYTTFLDGLGLRWYDRNYPDYSQAENFYLEVLNIMKPMLGDSTQNYANLLFDIGKLYESAATAALMEFDVYNAVQITQKARTYFFEALRLTESIAPDTNQSTLAFILVGLGRTYEEMGDYSKADTYYNEALHITQSASLEHTLDCHDLLCNIAPFFYHVGNYAKADSCYQEAEKIWDAAGVGVFYDYRWFFDYPGDEEYPMVERGRDAEKKKAMWGENSSEYLAELRCTCINYTTAGYYAKADSCLQEVLERAKAQLKKEKRSNSKQKHPEEEHFTYGYREIYLGALSDMGSLYAHGLGNYQKAESYYMRAIEAGDESTSTYESLGWLHYQMENYSKAESYYLQALKLETFPNEYLICDLGNVYMHMGNYAKADSCYQEALKFAEESKTPYYDASYEFGVIGKHMSALYLKMGAYAKAEPYIIQSMLKNKDDFIYVSGISDEKRLSEYWEWNYTPFARQYPRFSYLYYDEKPSISSFAYDNELFMKGLLLYSSKLVKENIVESQDTFLINQWNDLTSKKQSILNLQEKNPQSPMIEWLQREAQEQEQILNRYSSAYRKSRAQWEITWDSIRNHLSSGQVAIEYMVAPLNEDSTMYCALLLRDTCSRPIMIPLFNEPDGTSLINTNTDFRTNFTYSIDGRGDELSQLVWGKVLPYIKKGETIYFAPSGLLHQLAIESMPYDSTHTMSDVYNMVRLSSTREIVLNKTANTHTTATLYGGIQYNVDVEELLAESEAYSAKNLLASRGIEADTLNRGSVNYLAGTKTEVENINRMLRTNHLQVQLFTATNANEESFKSLSGTHQNILHIATHGFFWSDSTAQKKDFFAERMTRLGDDKPTGPIIDPLNRCGLLFAGANLALQGHSNELPEGVQDGILTAKEISLLDLRDADLVVLSACETGKGEITGDGVFGLQRAFKMAGVQTIIMSLWPVNDAATQMLMTEFYKNWITNHQSKRVAFRNAQNTVRSQYSEPAYWAGFVMLD